MRLQAKTTQKWRCDIWKYFLAISFGDVLFWYTGSVALEYKYNYSGSLLILLLQTTKPTVLWKNYLLIHAAIYATSGIFIFVKIKKAIWKRVSPKLGGSPVVRYIQYLDLICAPLLLLVWICMAVDCFCYQ